MTFLEISRLMAWQWCLDNSFEFIELYPEETELSDSGACVILSDSMLHPTVNFKKNS